MSSSHDKRRQKRAPVDLWVEVDRDGELYFQHAQNLSVGGAWFGKTIPLPVGTLVSMRFTLPGPEGTVISCQGKIVNTADWGMGVEFTELAPADRDAIVSLVDGAAPSSGLT